MFSSANRFSNPMSHAIPSGRPGDGSRESLTMGMRAWGNGFTWNLVSEGENVVSNVVRVGGQVVLASFQQVS